MKSLALFLSVFLLTLPALAVNPYFTFGFGSGGDSIESKTGRHSHGMLLGDSFLLSAGLILPITRTRPHAFEAQVGLGYQFFTESDDEELNKVTWSRWPLEAMYYYKNTRNQFRVGYGLTYHMNNRLKGKNLNSPVTTDAKNALGWVVSLEKYFENSGEVIGSWGVRYTFIDYTLERFSGSASGNSWMIIFTLASQTPSTPSQNSPRIYNPEDVIIE